jgi:hypothetical protein
MDSEKIRDMAKKQGRLIKEAMRKGLVDFLRDFPEGNLALVEKVTVAWMHGFICGAEFELDRKPK